MESAPVEGTRFYFTFLFINAKTKKIKTAADNIIGVKCIKDAMGLKILVVEDNAINASILISFLEK